MLGIHFPTIDFISRKSLICQQFLFISLYCYMHGVLITMFLHAHAVFFLRFVAEMFKNTVLLVDLSLTQQKFRLIFLNLFFAIKHWNNLMNQSLEMLFFFSPQLWYISKPLESNLTTFLCDMVVSRKKKKGMGNQWEKPENKRLQYIWEQLPVRYVCVHGKVCTLP